MPRRKNTKGDQYIVLNEAAQYEPVLAPGKTEIWYTTPESFRDLGMGLEFVAENFPEEYPEPLNLSKTHIMLGRIKCMDKNHIFHIMQGEQWSPEGEARKLIKRLGLHHTSMSVGDIVVIRGSAWFVDRMGWVNLGRVDKAE